MMLHRSEHSVRQAPLAPLLENRGYEPARQTPRSLFDWRAVYVRPEQLMRQPDGASDPVRTAWVAAQKIGPVEVCRPRLQRHRDIAEPERAPGAVMKHVHAQQAEVVLRTEDPHLDFPAFDQLRAAKHLVQPAIVEFERSAVQVHRASWSIGSRERCCCGSVVLWAHVQVEIPVRAQWSLRVQPCYCPSFSQ